MGIYKHKNDIYYINKQIKDQKIRISLETKDRYEAQDLYNHGQKPKVSKPYRTIFDNICKSLATDGMRFKSNKTLCKTLLLKIFDTKLCQPSYHQSGHAFDLSPKTDTVIKAGALHKRGIMIKETYIHFTLL